MQVKIKMPTEMEAENMKVDETGIELTPLFWDAGGKGVGGVIEVLSDKGTVLFRGVLSISARTGQASIDQRLNHVRARADK